MENAETETEEVFSKECIKMLISALDKYTVQECEKIGALDDYDFSDEFKRNMNKIFRQYIGEEKIPHSEVK